MWIIKDATGETQLVISSWWDILETVRLFNKCDKRIAFKRVIYSDKSKVQQVYKNLWVAFDGAGHQLALDILNPDDPESWTENLGAIVEMRPCKDDPALFDVDFFNRMVRVDLNNGWSAIWKDELDSPQHQPDEPI